MTRSAEWDHPEDPTAKKPFVDPLARALREHTYLLPRTQAGRHAHDLLDNLATALSEQATQTGHDPLFIRSPNDEAINIAARTLQESISILPAPHRPSLMVISETGWKDLEPDTNSRPADCIIVHQNEPLSEKQQEIVTQMAQRTHVIVCTTDFCDIGVAMKAGLLRSIDQKPIIAVQFADSDVKNWLLSYTMLTNNITTRLARDGWFMDSLITAVYEATDRTYGAVDKLPVAFVHATDDNQALNLCSEIQGKLPLKLHDRVAAIEKPMNLNEMDRYALKQWGQGGNSGVDILIAPTIPPRYRAPGNLKIMFLQPSNHPAALESILVRALQPNPSPDAGPITVRELTPPSPEKRKFITVPIILGWYSEPVPLPIPEPEIKPEPRPSTPIERPHESKTHTSKPKRRQMSLVTKSGINLRTIPEKEFNDLTANLTPQKRECLAAARKDKRVTQIALDAKRSTTWVYISINAALLDIAGGSGGPAEKSKRDAPPTAPASETPNIQPATPETIQKRSCAKPASLITPEGVDLRKIPSDELELHMKALTQRQQEVMAIALKNVPTPEIARLLLTQTENINTILQTGLRRIDHPKVTKEKTHAPRKQSQFLFKGQSLFDIPEDQRKEIYARVHLTPRHILATESYNFAKQNGLEVLNHVAQSVNAPSNNAAGVMLVYIRKKLAHFT